MRENPGHVPGELQTGVDLRDAYGGKFINASEAEGSNVHDLNVEGLSIPVSLIVEDRRFRMNGLEKQSKLGVIISGIVGKGEVKINHILVDGNLRGGVVSQALLKDLETQLTAQGTELAYATFANFKTVNFFIRNGYEVMPPEELDGQKRESLSILPGDLDDRVRSSDDFERLKAAEGIEFRQVLLRKQLQK